VSRVPAFPQAPVATEHCSKLARDFQTRASAGLEAALAGYYYFDSCTGGQSETVNECGVSR
jgi:hypothetical protein